MSIMQVKLDRDFLRRQTPGKLLRKLIKTQLPSFDQLIIVDNWYDYSQLYVMFYAIENFIKESFLKPI